MGFLETLEDWEYVCKRTHFYLARKIFTHLGSINELSPTLYGQKYRYKSIKYKHVSPWDFLKIFIFLIFDCGTSTITS